jgi:hypothetical protein
MSNLSIQKNLRIRTFVLTALICGSVAPSVFGDDKATRAVEKSLNLPVGEKVDIYMASKKAIKEAFIENEGVARVLAVTGEPSRLILIGRAVGRSQLELTDVDGRKEVYLLVVEKRRLAAEVRPGYLAMAVKVSTVDAVGGLVDVGDHVSVFVLRLTGKTAANSSLLMKNIRVLAIEDSNDSVPAGPLPGRLPEQPPRSRALVLELTELEAKRILAAQCEGSLNLALHSRADSTESQLKDRKGDGDK